MERRLGKLEIIWPRPEMPKPGHSPDDIERRYLSMPALWLALDEAAESRGRRRFLEPGQPADIAWSAWHRLDEAERRARQATELELLDGLVRDLGRAAGLETWVRESVAIAPMWDGEGADYVWKMFQYMFASLRLSLDRSRAKHPAWALETGWHPDMDDDAFLQFEWDLLERVGALWADAGADPPR